MLHSHCNIFQTLHSMLPSSHLANPPHWDTAHLLWCKDAVNTQSTDWAKITAAQCSGVQWLRVVDDVSPHQVIQYSSMAFGSISECTVQSKRWENNSITAMLYCCFALAFLWFIKFLGFFYSLIHMHTLFLSTHSQQHPVLYQIPIGVGFTV